MSEDINKNINMDGGDDKCRRIRDSSRRTQPNGPYHRNNKKEEDMRLWGILIFGIIGATVTTFAVGQLRRTADWFYIQSQSQFRGTTGGFSSSRSRSSFQEEARRRYSRRMREEYEEEMERVERIRRMQRMFNREKNKYRRGYERWREDSSSSGEYDQHFQRDDWYWKTDASYGYGYGNWSPPPPAADADDYSMSHHYAILGLTRSRTMPYTDDEIKTAFRSKAKQYHPDQNQENKDIAEARFKEVMNSYEAIKSERKNIK